MNKRSLFVGLLIWLPLWFALLTGNCIFFGGDAGQAVAQDVSESLSGESSFFVDSAFVDPASPVKDDQPQYNVRQSLLTGNPPVREFDPKRPLILSAQKSFGRQGSGYANTRYLMIQYPWSRIEGASLEIRVLDDIVKEKPIWCVPVFFNEVYRKHQKINDLVFQKRLPGGQRAFGASFFDKDFMLGELLPESEVLIWSFGNLLEKKGVIAHIIKENNNTRLDETTLSYPELSDWSANDNTLFLELMGSEFDGNCDIRIWFIKGASIVWEEDFVWPGNLNEPELKAKEAKNKKITKSLEAEKAAALEEDQEDNDTF